MPILSACSCTRSLLTSTFSVFESILMGCIPAIVSDDNELPFARFTDYSEFSVRIKESDAAHVREILEQVPESTIRKMQKRLRTVW